MQHIKIVKPMSPLIIVCRACLATEGKFYRYYEFQLQSYYEEMMGLTSPDNEKLPQFFCMECAALLQKFHNFKEKCCTARDILLNMLRKGGITSEAVSSVNRKEAKLVSPLDVMKLSDRAGVFYSGEVNIKNIEKVEYTSLDQAVIKSEIPNLDIEKEEDMFCFDDIDEHAEVEVDMVEDEKVSIHNESEGSVKNEIENEDEKPNVKVSNRRIRLLDADSWVKVSLSEEDAVNEFKMKCLDPTYMKSPYKCEDCFRGFSKEEMYNRHLLLRHNESLGNFICALCKMRFKWGSHLRIHTRKHFTKYQCQRCHFVCSLESSALLHEEYHSGVPKKCIHCSEEFRHVSTYYTHLRNVHRSEFICTYCGVSFVSEAGLNQHKKVKHVIVDMYPQESPDDDEEVNTYCDRCDIMFHTRKAYDEHKFHSVMHAEGVEDEMNDDLTVPRKVLGKRLKAKINKGIVRHIQDDTYKSPEAKRRRRLKRRRRIPTTCHQCGQHFDTQTACMRHHLEAHPGTSFYPPQARHICELCGVSLAPGSVAAHHNLHTREKVYPCDSCGRQFHSTVGLKRHLVTHTGEKRYGCSLCEKRFTQSNSMKLHYRTFHLRQPYPKRNRKKKPDPAQMVEVEESERECSEDELQEVVMMPAQPIDVQYLTLE